MFKLNTLSPDTDPRTSVKWVCSPNQVMGIVLSLHRSEPRKCDGGVQLVFPLVSDVPLSSILPDKNIGILRLENCMAVLLYHWSVEWRGNNQDTFFTSQSRKGDPPSWINTHLLSFTSFEGHAYTAASTQGMCCKFIWQCWQNVTSGIKSEDKTLSYESPCIFYWCRELLANLTCMADILDLIGGIILCCLKTLDPETTEVGGQRTTAVLDDQRIKFDWSQFYFCCPRAATPFPFSPLHLIVDNFYVTRLAFRGFLTSSCFSILYFVGRSSLRYRFQARYVMCV